MPDHIELDRTERRIIGTMIEKAFTVPDAYPLTLATLVTGCSQKSNRDPVMDIPEHHVEGALKSLFMGGWVEKSSRHGGRVARWGHRVPDRLDLDSPQQAIFAELLLRGPQTIGALRTRASRMVSFATTDAVLEVLGGLAGPEHGLVERLARRPGERVEKWRHRLGGEEPMPEPEFFEPPPAAPSPTPPSPPPVLPTTPTVEDDRVAALATEVLELREEVRALRSEVESLRNG